MTWIPLRKQKPPLDTEILIFQQFKYGHIIKIAEYVRVRNKKRPQFGSDIRRENDGTVYGGYPEENVTHWMPLPEPPKVKSKAKVQDEDKYYPPGKIYEILYVEKK